MTKVRDAGKTKPAIAKNAFAGQAKKPSEGAVASVLGPTLPLWTGLVAELKREFKIDAIEWHTGFREIRMVSASSTEETKYSLPGTVRRILPANFALGDRAVAAAKNSELPAEVLKIIADATRYVEGTAVRIPVTKPGDLIVVKKLAKIKIEN